MASNTITHASTDRVIDLDHVSKTYRGWWGGKKVHALRGISMRVHAGEIFGLLGPNGAGKSTLVKILMTIIRAGDCRGTMLGRPVGEKDVLARVGYLPEHHKFPDYLTGAQVLDFYGALSSVPRPLRRRRAGELLDLVGIEKWAALKVKGYSKGMRQRLGIANTLMSEPDLVLLDEPTDGVDPVGRRDIRNILLRLKEQGKTVFLNSHLLSELEMVCDRVAILVQGAVSAQGTIDELTRESRRYEIELAPPNATQPPPDLRSQILSVIRPLALPAPNVPDAAPAEADGELRLTLAESQVLVSVHKSGFRVGTDDPEVVQPLIDALRQRRFTIRAVRPVRASLEDLFMLAVTDPTTGQALKPGAADAPGSRAKRPRPESQP